MSYVLYGIKACDTMKKARTWLDEHQVDYAFTTTRASESTVQTWKSGATSMAGRPS